MLMQHVQYRGGKRDIGVVVRDYEGVVIAAS